MTARRLWMRMRLFWITGVRNLAAHRLRVALSAVGIAAGVALAVGVGAISSSIDASVRDTAEAAAGLADLEVRPPADVGMPVEMLTEVRSTPGVIDAGATVESFTLVRGRSDTRALVIGVDSGVVNLAPSTGERSAFPDADPLGLYLSRPLADELGISSAQDIRLATSKGWQPVAVSGLLPEELIAARLAVGPLSVVQTLLGQEGRVDSIYLRSEDPVAVASRLEAGIGDRVRIGTPGFRAAEARQLVRPVTTALGASALVALFVGAFLVYNTMAMAASTRRREAGLLRALGAGRGQLLRYFCAEGAVLGAVGAATGVGLGVLLARVVLVRRGAVLEEIFPVALDRMVLRYSDLLVAVGAGVLAAVLASVLPARRMARVDPVVALRPAGPLEDPEPQRRLPVPAAGAVLLLAGLGVGIASTAGGISTGWMLAGFVLLLGGLTLLLRSIVPLGASILARWATRPGSPVPRSVRFGAGSVLRAPARTTFTAGAMVLALSLVVGFPIALSTLSASSRTWMEERLDQDLHIQATAGGPLLLPDVRLDPALGEELERVPGVEGVADFRSVTGSIDGQVAIFQGGHDPTEHDSFPQLRDAPRDVVVSQVALRSFGLEVGDSLDLSTPDGIQTVRVVGITADPDSLYPQFRLGGEGFEQLWGQVGVDSFALYLTPGADPFEVRSRILERFGSRFGVEVQTAAEFQASALGLLDAIGDMLSSVTVIAVMIAALGMANTLLISTLERRREIGVLRAVGMLRRQVVGLVATEALIVAAVGIVLASLAGTGLGYVMRAILEGESGMSMPMVFPPSAYLAAALLGIMAAVGAVVLPARRAAGAEISEAVQYE